jgi:S1-C subfamily serine protease
VTLSDGRTASATVASATKNVDLAKLKIGLQTPHYLPLAAAASTKVGDPAFTVGYPVPDLLGNESKFTDGSVSALSGMFDEATLMQVTVPVQPGNSGGPLLNNRGQVIGVITSTAAPAFFARATGALPQGINWAVKVDYLTPLVGQVGAVSPMAGRSAAIEHARKAVCLVKVTR